MPSSWAREAGDFSGAQVIIMTVPGAEATQPDSLTEAVIASASDLLFVVDCKMRVRFQNRPVGERPVEATVGQPVLELFDSATRPVAEEKIRQVLTTGERGQFKDVRARGRRLKAYDLLLTK